MKRLILLLTIVAVIAAMAWQPAVDTAYAAYYATKVYIAQGGDTLHVKDGGVVDINGRADVDSATIAVATIPSLVATDGTFSNDLTVDDDLAADTLKTDDDDQITIIDDAVVDSTLNVKKDVDFDADLNVDSDVVVDSTLTVGTTLDVAGGFSGLRNIYTITADSTLTTAATKPGGVIYVTGNSEITLPAAAAGLEYTFVTVGTDSTIILPASGDNIDHDGAADAANYCATGTANEVVTLVAKDGTSWNVVEEQGTWGTY